jgi:hypothetical protein
MWDLARISRGVSISLDVDTRKRLPSRKPAPPSDTGGPNTPHGRTIAVQRFPGITATEPHQHEESGLAVSCPISESIFANPPHSGAEAVKIST